MCIFVEMIVKYEFSSFYDPTQPSGSKLWRSKQIRWQLFNEDNQAEESLEKPKAENNSEPILNGLFSFFLFAFFNSFTPPRDFRGVGGKLPGLKGEENDEFLCRKMETRKLTCSPNHRFFIHRQNLKKNV